MTLLLDLRDQTFANQTDSFATRTPCTRMHSTTGANKKSASTRSAIGVSQGCGLIRTEFSVGTGGPSLLCLYLLQPDTKRMGAGTTRPIEKAREFSGLYGLAAEAAACSRSGAAWATSLTPKKTKGVFVPRSKLQ